MLLVLAAVADSGFCRGQEGVLVAVFISRLVVGFYGGHVDGVVGGVVGGVVVGAVGFCCFSWQLSCDEADVLLLSDLLLRGRRTGGGAGGVEDISGGLVDRIASERGKMLDVVKFCRVVSARGTGSPILWRSSCSCFLWQ